MTPAQEALAKLCADALPGNPLARVRALDEAEDKPAAAVALIRDPSFLAALHVADPALREILDAELRSKAKLTKAAVEAAVQGFVASFRAPPREPTPEELAAAEAKAEAEAERTARVDAAADALLRDPQLLDRFHADLVADGLVGERAAGETLLLVVTTRKTARPVHAVIKAASSTGKNFLLGLVLHRLPPEDVKLISDMSARALLYLTESIKGKVLAIAEQEGAQKADYTIRTAQSEGSLTVWVAEKAGENGPFTTRQHTVEGPACIITTTTRAKLHDENETRNLEITLDESPEQTKRINIAQAQRAAHPATAEDQAQAAERVEIWRSALGKLELTETINPHAPTQAAKFSAAKIRARRDFQRVLDLASARALLFQKQRQAQEGRVVVSAEDMAAAVELCAALQSDVAPRLRSFVARLRVSFGVREFTPAEAAKILGYDPDAIRRMLHDAAEAELVEETEAAKGSKAGRWRLCVPPAGSPPPSDSPTSTDNSGRSDKSQAAPAGYGSSDRPTGETGGAAEPRPGPALDVSGEVGCSDGRTVGQNATPGNGLGNCPSAADVGQNRTVGRAAPPPPKDTLSELLARMLRVSKGEGCRNCGPEFQGYLEGSRICGLCGLDAGAGK